jgi:hypothetical protein
VAASRIACLAARSCQYRSPVSPLYTPEELLDSRAGRLPAINSPQAILLTVRHSGRGHRDLLPGHYGVADEWNRRRNSSMISRAPARGGARKGVSILGYGSAPGRSPIYICSKQYPVAASRNVIALARCQSRLRWCKRFARGVRLFNRTQNKKARHLAGPFDDADTPSTTTHQFGKRRVRSV